METLLGCIMMYSWVHAIVLQIQRKSYKDMSTYEQIVTILAITAGILVFIGLLME